MHDIEVILQVYYRHKFGISKTQAVSDKVLEAYSDAVSKKFDIPKEVFIEGLRRNVPKEKMHNYKDVRAIWLEEISPMTMKIKQDWDDKFLNGNGFLRNFVIEAAAMELYNRKFKKEEYIRIQALDVVAKQQVRNKKDDQNREIANAKTVISRELINRGVSCSFLKPRFEKYTISADKIFSDILENNDPGLTRIVSLPEDVVVISQNITGFQEMVDAYLDGKICHKNIIDFAEKTYNEIGSNAHTIDTIDDIVIIAGRSEYIFGTDNRPPADISLNKTKIPDSLLKEAVYKFSTDHGLSDIQVEKSKEDHDKDDDDEEGTPIEVDENRGNEKPSDNMVVEVPIEDKDNGIGGDGQEDTIIDEIVKEITSSKTSKQSNGRFVSYVGLNSLLNILPNSSTVLAPCRLYYAYTVAESLKSNKAHRFTNFNILIDRLSSLEPSINWKKHLPNDTLFFNGLTINKKSKLTNITINSFEHSILTNIVNIIYNDVLGSNFNKLKQLSLNFNNGIELLDGLDDIVSFEQDTPLDHLDNTMDKFSTLSSNFDAMITDPMVMIDPLHKVSIETKRAFSSDYLDNIAFDYLLDGSDKCSVKTAKKLFMNHIKGLLDGTIRTGSTKTESTEQFLKRSIGMPNIGQRVGFEYAIKVIRNSLNSDTNSIAQIVKAIKEYKDCDLYKLIKNYLGFDVEKLIKISIGYVVDKARKSFKKADLFRSFEVKRHMRSCNDHWLDSYSNFQFMIIRDVAESPLHVNQCKIIKDKYLSSFSLNSDINSDLHGQTNLKGTSLLEISNRVGLSTSFIRKLFAKHEENYSKHFNSPITIERFTEFDTTSRNQNVSNKLISNVFKFSISYFKEGSHVIHSAHSNYYKPTSIYNLRFLDFYLPLSNNFNVNTNLKFQSPQIREAFNLFKCSMSMVQPQSDKIKLGVIVNELVPIVEELNFDELANESNTQSTKPFRLKIKVPTLQQLSYANIFKLLSWILKFNRTSEYQSYEVFKKYLTKYGECAYNIARSTIIGNKSGMFAPSIATTWKNIVDSNSDSDHHDDIWDKFCKMRDLRIANNTITIDMAPHSPWIFESNSVYFSNSKNKYTSNVLSKDSAGEFNLDFFNKSTSLIKSGQNLMDFQLS